MHKILLIDDDPVVRSLISGILRKKDYMVILAKEGQEGLKMVKDEAPDLVICDYQMPGISGIDVLYRIRESHPGLPVIILTAYGDATLTIKSMQTGAFDFIEKPINPRELLSTVKNGLKTIDTVKKEDKERPAEKGGADVNLMVGKTPDMRDIFKQVGRISQNNVNVVLSGESGSGKERLARLIHRSGYNKDNPIVIVNCKTLAEEQLQGSRGVSSPERLAALDEKISGASGGGTVVLDEVGMLSPQMQMRLLEHLSHDLTGVDRLNPRFISTTTQDIHALVDEGLFIKELYYKLKVFSISVPPLRKRKEDIPELVRHLLQELNPAFDRKVVRIEEGVIELLQTYSWPGNVRELKNVLMQALVLSHNELLEKKHIRIEQDLSDEIAENSDPEEEPRSMAEVEKEHIAHVLKYVSWNKQRAASILGITRPTLNAKIEKYHLANY